MRKALQNCPQLRQLQILRKRRTLSFPKIEGPLIKAQGYESEVVVLPGMPFKSKYVYLWLDLKYWDEILQELERGKAAKCSAGSEFSMMRDSKNWEDCVQQ